jgi:hypothetical protein
MPQKAINSYNIVSCIFEFSDYQEAIIIVRDS